MIGIGLGLFFSILLSLFGKGVFSLLGGHGETLRLAVVYSNIVFAFAAAIWLSNLLAWLTRRASATDVSKRLDLAVRLLIGDGEHPKV